VSAALEVLAPEAPITENPPAFPKLDPVIPRVTLSTLARAMGPTRPAQLARLLQGHKYAESGPRRSYQCAVKQITDSLVDGVPVNPDAPLRKHERDAIKSYLRAPLPLPKLARAVRPKRRSHWLLHGVNVSMHPDIELDGFVYSGAVKLTLTKEPLARGVASLMASLMWFWRVRVEKEILTARSHCIVYEPRLPWLHLPGKNPVKDVAKVEIACRLITALWPVI
jgi:hypothetical protein